MCCFSYGRNIKELPCQILDSGKNDHCNGVSFFLYHSYDILCPQCLLTLKPVNMQSNIHTHTHISHLVDKSSNMYLFWTKNTSYPSIGLHPNMLAPYYWLKLFCWNEHLLVEHILTFPKVSPVTKILRKYCKTNIRLDPKLKNRLKHFLIAKWGLRG